MGDAETLAAVTDDSGAVPATALQALRECSPTVPQDVIRHLKELQSTHPCNEGTSTAQRQWVFSPCDAGVFDTLVAAMRAHAKICELQGLACTVICSLAFAQRDTCPTLALDAGAMKAVVAALRSHVADSELVRHACCALDGMALSSKAATHICSSGAPAAVVAALRVHSALPVAYSCFEAMAQFARRCLDAKHAMIAAGALEAVVDAMRAQLSDEDVQHHGCDVLSTMCFESNRKTLLRAGRAGAVQAVLAALEEHGHDEDIVSTACWALTNMIDVTCNVEAAASAGAVKLVLKALQSHVDDEDVNENGLSVIYGLCEDNADNAASAVSLNGIELVLAALQRFRTTSCSVQCDGLWTLLALIQHDDAATRRAMAAGALPFVSANSPFQSDARFRSARDTALRCLESFVAEAEAAAAELIAEEEAASAAASKKQRKGKSKGKASADGTGGSAEAEAVAAAAPPPAPPAAAAAELEATASTSQASAAAEPRRRHAATEPARHAAASSGVADASDAAAASAEHTTHHGAPAERSAAGALEAEPAAATACAPAAPASEPLLGTLFPQLTQLPPPPPPPPPLLQPQPASAVASLAQQVAPNPWLSAQLPVPPSQPRPAALARPANAQLSALQAQMAKLEAANAKLESAHAQQAAVIAKLEAERTCVICLDATRATLLLPCRHVPLCGAPACAAMLGAPPLCPLCREAVADTMQLFL